MWQSSAPAPGERRWLGTWRRKQIPVRLWAHEPEVARAIQSRRENQLFLPGVSLPRDLVGDEQPVGCSWREPSCLIFAVPSHVARPVLRTNCPGPSEPIPLVSATKGIEEDTLRLVTQVMDGRAAGPYAGSLLVLSGPSFAAEVSERGRPTALCLAGQDASREDDSEPLYDPELSGLRG